jgi:hypothetical protein
LKSNGWLLLIGVVLLVMACEIIFHWLLGQGTFPTVLGLYLWVDPVTKKGTFPREVINAAPAVILGCANGWIGYSRWSVRTLFANAVILALFMNTLTHLLMRNPQFAFVGRPWIFDAFTTVVHTSFFTLGVFVFFRDWKRRRS